MSLERTTSHASWTLGSAKDILNNSSDFSDKDVEMAQKIKDYYDRCMMPPPGKTRKTNEEIEVELRDVYTRVGSIDGVCQYISTQQSGGNMMNNGNRIMKKKKRKNTKKKKSKKKKSKKIKSKIRSKARKKK